MSIFGTAMAALASGPLGETVTWRPRVGRAFTVRILETQAEDREIAGQFLVKQLAYDCLAEDFPADPCERDVVMFGSTARFVKSVERVNGGMFWRVTLGDTR